VVRLYNHNIFSQLLGCLWWDDVGTSSCVFAIQSPFKFSALGSCPLTRILSFKLVFSLTSR
jgi:hypothetical protein